MSTGTTLEIESTKLEDTLAIGVKLGKRLQGGEVIELISDLGGGKTSLVRGIAKGIGSNDQVASPTFTISRVYTSPKLELHHFDFYRLDDPGIISAELDESVNDPETSVVIEWAGVVKDVLPKDRIKINIESRGETKRKLKLSSSGAKSEKVLKGLK